MVDLEPHRGDDKVAVPFTFDTKYDINHLDIKRIILAALIQIVAIIAWIVILIIASKDDYRIIASVVALVGVPLICRYAIIGEYRFRKGYLDLKEKNYTFKYNLFWGIFDTTTTLPTFFRRVNGTNSIFIAFDKDVVVGKGDDNDYMHFEAISEAYNILAKKEGISCVHIDYMDNVGKDTRLQAMMEEVDSCPVENLRDYVYDIYECMQAQMSTTFSDYDVYCFTADMRTDLLLDELMPVLDAFMGGNYIRYRILDRNEVRELVSSVMGIKDFSVTRACDNIFEDKSMTNVLRVIWTERDGKREKVNKTQAELAEEMQRLKEEKEARRHGHRHKVTATPAESTAVFSNQGQSAQQNTSPFTKQPVQQARPQMPQQSMQAQQNGSPFMTNTSQATVTRPVNRMDAPSPFAKSQQKKSNSVPPAMLKLQQASAAQKKGTVKEASSQDAQAAFAQLNQQAAERSAMFHNPAPTSGTDNTSEIIDLFDDTSGDDEIDLFGD